MSKTKVLMLVGNQYMFNKVVEAGIEVVSKTLAYEEILAEVNITDATHVVLHDVYLNGGPYRKRVEQLRKANESVNMLLITRNKKPDASAKKAYADNRMECIAEGNGISEKIIQFIRSTSSSTTAPRVSNATPTKEAKTVNPPKSSEPEVQAKTRQAPAVKEPETLSTKAKPLLTNPKPLQPEVKPAAQMPKPRQEMPKPKPKPLPPEPKTVEPEPLPPEPISAEPEPLPPEPTQTEPAVPYTMPEPIRVEETPLPPEPGPMPIQPEKSRLPRRPTQQPIRKKESVARAAFSVPVTITQIRQPQATVVIPVFSGNRGAGCTWLCVQMATYLTSHGMSCAVSGGTDILYFSPKGELERFTLNDVDFYGGVGLPGLLTSGYDYIILDVGQIIGFHADHTATALITPELAIECQRAPHKYLVTDYTLGHELALEEITKNRTWRNFAANCTVLLTPRQPEGIEQRLIKRYQCPVYTLPTCEPFTLSTEMNTFLGTVLRPNLITKEEQIH